MVCNRTLVIKWICQICEGASEVVKADTIQSRLCTHRFFLEKVLGARGVCSFRWGAGFCELSFDLFNLDHRVILAMSGQL